MITKYFQNKKRFPILLLCFIFVVLIFSYTQLFHPCLYFDENNIKTQTERWGDCIDVWGGKVAHAFFKQTNKVVPNQYKHINAHMFGNALYNNYSLEKALLFCDYAYWEGCFHELLSRAFLDGGYSTLKNIAETCKKILSSTYSTTCLHGFGHGLIALGKYTTDDLREALDFCSLHFSDTEGKKDASRRGSDYFGNECYHGVFMEYNERNMLPELGPRELDFKNIYTPCDTLDSEYKATCYHRLAFNLWPHNISNINITVKYNTLISWCRDIPQKEYHYSCVSGVRTSMFFVPEISAKEKKKVLNLVDEVLREVRAFSAPI
ncbi:MAG: hypothetical protein HYT93_00080 [Parcubacteria group bacterium]|nr:hypothetical protein [Parcubacteria group bacterium]